MMPKKYILSFILLAVLFGVYFYQKIYLSAWINLKL